MSDKDAVCLTGSTPYAKSHSAKPGTLAQHAASSGRGGPGKFGGADGNRGMRSDLGHPESHAAFEELGRSSEGK